MSVWKDFQLLLKTREHATIFKILNKPDNELLTIGTLKHLTTVCHRGRCPIREQRDMGVTVI